MTIENERPKWPYSVNEELANRLCHGVDTIQYRQTVISLERVDEWLELTTPQGEKLSVSLDFFTKVGSPFRFSPGGTLKLVSADPNMRSLMGRIQLWEKSNEAERAEYERLKRKFES